ncbi:hypothetical protein QRQ56_35095 [Bradyrhizobium sp. U531]|uniref:hypothetical protein n=1 Tax=Bradyrhizobium sp. U531 TaxID=3053458 RepID=UPI003F43FA6B
MIAAAAMPLAALDRWLQARLDQHPAATNLPMLDDYVAANVAGPLSMNPLDWICPLLAIDADAFNHGGAPEFAAISAAALRHNEISQILRLRLAGSRRGTGAIPWRRRSACLVPRFLSRDAAQPAGVATVAGRHQRQTWPASAHSCRTVATMSL